MINNHDLNLLVIIDQVGTGRNSQDNNINNNYNKLLNSTPFVTLKIINFNSLVSIVADTLSIFISFVAIVDTPSTSFCTPKIFYKYILMYPTYFIIIVIGNLNYKLQFSNPPCIIGESTHSILIYIKPIHPINFLYNQH